MIKAGRWRPRTWCNFRRKSAEKRVAFTQPEPRDRGPGLASRRGPRFEKLGRLMDEAEHDVLAYMIFAVQHRTKLHFDEFRWSG